MGSRDGKRSAGAGRGRAPAAGEPRRGGVLRFAYHLQPPSLDPHETVSVGLMNPAALAYSRLLRFRVGADVEPRQLSLEPDLAEAWEQTDDVSYFFRLRRGVRFHNVAPVNCRELTAEDVEYTVRRVLTHPAAGQKHLFADIDRMEILDRYTVKFVLKSPNAAFLRYVASPFTWIIPREVVEQFGSLKTHMIGTGPFIVKEYTPNVSLIFKRNPDYFEVGLPYVDEVHRLIVPDESARISAFRAGELDIISVSVPTQAQGLRRSVPGAGFEAVVNSSWPKVSFRTDRKELPFADRRVRQAISLALDREGMLQAVLGGEGVIGGPISASFEWALSVDRLGAGSRYYRQDLTEAKRLLALAGYGGGFKFNLVSTQQLGQQHVQWLEMIKANLAEVNIDVNLVWQEFTTFVTTTYVGKYDEATGSRSGSSVDSDEFLTIWYGPGSPRNLSYVNDPIPNEMMIRQRRTNNQDQRRIIIEEIQRYLAEQQYYITGVIEYSYTFWQDRVRNYRPHVQAGQYQLARTWLSR